MSIAITAVMMHVTGLHGSAARTGFAIATIVPSIVAPIVAGLLGRILDVLDQASTELRHLSRTDPLTGVLNRRAFVADAEALRATRSDEVLVVVMTDIDDFKGVNDRHGHATGDRALCLIASNLAAALDGGGVLGRLGGDEFAIVALSVGADEADALVLRLRSACALDGALPGLQASLGALVTATPISLDEALQGADHSLYRAKRGSVRLQTR